MRKAVYTALGALGLLALMNVPAGAQASGSTSISVNPITGQPGIAASFLATCTYPTGSTGIAIITNLSDPSGNQFAAFGGSNPDYTNKPQDQDANGQTTRSRGASFTYPSTPGTGLLSGQCRFTPPGGSQQALNFSQEFVIQQAATTTTLATTTTVATTTTIGPGTTAAPTIPATTGPTATTTAPSGQLPATGSNLALLALLGAGSVAAGGIAVARGRHRDIA